MIARAMNTGPEDHLTYRELARQGARLSRVLDARELARLWPLLSHADEVHPTSADVPVPVNVTIELRLDAEGRPWVDGAAILDTKLLCNRCAEAVPSRLASEFSLCLVADEERASELAETRDVHVVRGPTLSVVELVEDALLLELPERLCAEEPCPRMPALAYPAGGSRVSGSDDAIEGGRGSPFAALAALKESRAGGEES